MPTVDIQSSNDFVSIHYRTNSKFGNVGGFNPAKPTIVLLHPAFLDSSWLQNQFGDPRLDLVYNMIAFDMRVSGQSSSIPSGSHDSWVEAADLARCFQSLWLPPSHILALEGLSVYCAQRFAVLWPDLCLSLTLCNVPSPTELKWLYTAYDELLQSWCASEDLESFEHVASECATYLVGRDCDPDLRDDLVEYWQRNCPPTTRRRIVELFNASMNRTPLKNEVLATIKQPVLILHGEWNEACPKKYAEQLVSQLINAQGGAVLYTVRGGGGNLAIIPGSASIMNQIFTKFVGRLPHTRSDIVCPSISIEERMRTALQKLVTLTGDAHMGTRDPMSNLSFSCLPPDVVKSQTEALEFFKRGEREAFNPLDFNGHPIRRFSDRQDGHWFSAGKDGLSVAGSKQEAPPHERSLPLPRSEPMPTEVAQDGRLRRATFTPTSIDKSIIKGSMAKVVSIGTAPTTPFQRLLM